MSRSRACPEPCAVAVAFAVRACGSIHSKYKGVQAGAAVGRRRSVAVVVAVVARCQRVIITQLIRAQQNENEECQICDELPLVTTTAAAAAAAAVAASDDGW